MTKPRPSATSLPPSKLCRLLIITFVFKLFVLGLLIFDPGVPEVVAELPGFSSLFSNTPGSGPQEANAATGEAAGAPPAVEAGLPDVGMRPGAPAAAPERPGSPGAVPGVSTPAFGGQDDEGRALPPIVQRSSAAPGSANGTGDAPLRDALARKQEDMARKEQELRVLESELAGRLEKMQMLENRLAVMIKEADETKDAKFRHLVDVLSNMKAKQAAAVLETLDPKIAVRVLAGMRGRQAGEILTYVKPEIAAQLSESLARMQMPLE